MSQLGPNSLAQFSNLLTKVVDKGFRDTKAQIATYIDKYTKEGDTSQGQDYRSTTAVGLGQWAYTSEFGQFHRDSFEPGQERTSTWVKYTNGVTVSEELLLYMARNSRVREDKIKMFQDINQEFKDTWAWTKEVIGTLFQTSGTSTTATTAWPGAGRDSLALFSASHTTLKAPVVTCSNIQGAQSLTQLAIQEIITILRNIKNDEGRPQRGVGKILIQVGPYWEWRMPEIMGTAKQVDTANNNINVLTDQGKAAQRTKVEFIVNDYLAADDTSWMVLDENYHQLMRFEALEPMFSKEKDIATGASIFKSTAIFGIDHLSWRGVARCAGA
jgi:hypothetical protein